MAVDEIDFSLGWGPWPDEEFTDMIRDQCANRKLSFLICKDDNVNQVIRGVKAGTKRILFHLDAQAEYEDDSDDYGRLGHAARNGGAFVVNDPDRAKVGINKAIMHCQFVRAGIPVPYSIVVGESEPTDFKLTPSQCQKLGQPCIIKPARGYGGQGVAQVDGHSVKEIASARRYDKGDDFLLQQLVEPEWFGHRMGWFRVFYLLGEVIICWWDKVTEHYACATTKEFDDYHLMPLWEIAWNIAQTTHMNFFSTELAIVGTGSARRCLAIDYVNDPCDMTLQTQSHCGVPDRVVGHIAERLVLGAWRVKKGLDPSEGFGIWFGSET
jgi:hypothetical protein